MYLRSSCPSAFIGGHLLIHPVLSIFASCPRQRKRFRVKAGTAIRTVNAAAEYANVPGKLPEDTSITKGLIKAHDFIPLFVTDKAGGR